MVIEVQCPNGHVLHVREKHAGKLGACPRCSAPVRVPLHNAVEEIALKDGLLAPIAIKPASDDSRDVLYHDFEPIGAGSDSSSLSGLISKEKICIECGKAVSQSFGICPRCATPLTVYKNLTIRKEGDVVVIKVTRPQIVDEESVKEVIDDLVSVTAAVQSHDLLLDFSKVVAVTGLMLGRLVMLHKKMQQKGHELKLQHASRQVRHALTVAKLDQVLHVEDA